MQSVCSMAMSPSRKACCSLWKTWIRHKSRKVHYFCRKQTWGTGSVSGHAGCSGNSHNSNERANPRGKTQSTSDSLRVKMETAFTYTKHAPCTRARVSPELGKVVSGDAFGNVHVWLVETGLLAFRYVHVISWACALFITSLYVLF